MNYIQWRITQTENLVLGIRPLSKYWNSCFLSDLDFSSVTFSVNKLQIRHPIKTFSFIYIVERIYFLFLRKNSSWYIY